MSAGACGDANWLTQLLLNLLDNALRHTPRGGRVALSVQSADQEVAIRVAEHRAKGFRRSICLTLPSASTASIAHAVGAAEPALDWPSARGSHGSTAAS